MLKSLTEDSLVKHSVRLRKEIGSAVSARLPRPVVDADPSGIVVVRRPASTVLGGGRRPGSRRAGSVWVLGQAQVLDAAPVFQAASLYILGGLGMTGDVPVVTPGSPGGSLMLTDQVGDDGFDRRRRWCPDHTPVRATMHSRYRAPQSALMPSVIDSGTVGRR